MDVIHGAVEKKVYTAANVPNFKDYLQWQVLQPLRNRLEDEMMQLFRCPADVSAVFATSDIEKLFVAKYFLDQEKGFQNKKGKVNMEMGPVIRKYLLDLGIAQKRTYSDKWHTDNSERDRQNEVRNMLKTLDGPNASLATVQVGQSKSWERDLEDTLIWAKHYPVEQEMKRILRIDQDRVVKTSELMNKVLPPALK